MSVMVRKARLEDISALIEFQQGLAHETEGIKLDESLLEQGLGAIIKDPSKGFYFVAELQGQPVGCCMVTFEWSEWRNGTVYWLQSVYVKHSHRGAGVFKKLYEHLMTMVASDPKIFGMKLYANKSNTKAHQIYKSLGMDGDHYVMFEKMKD